MTISSSYLNNEVRQMHVHLTSVHAFKGSIHSDGCVILPFLDARQSLNSFTDHFVLVGSGRLLMSHT